MNFYLDKILNHGVDENTDIEEVKKIRIYNFFLIVQVVISTIVFLFVLSDNFGKETIQLVLFICLLMLIPVTLSLYKKKFLSQIANMIVNYINISTVCVLCGPEINIHNYLLVTAILPFLWFRREIKLRYFFSSLAVLNWMLLVTYFSISDGVYLLDFEDTDLIGFIDDLAVAGFIISLFYIITKENDIQLEKLKLKTQEIEEKNIELERFSFIASHDLKEPLRTVQSFNQIIKEEFKEHINDDLNLYFKFINDALVRMKEMIDGLLQYSVVGSSNKIANIDLNCMINELKNDLSNLLKSSNAIIQKSKLPTITGGDVELRLVFQNLITNAIKFKPANKQPIVEISFTKQPNFWQFCIADNGIGIEKKKQVEIFEIFNKLHSSDKYEGQGLGLAFCKKIVESHNGKIWVESALGEGSKFYFTIPNDNYTEKEA